MRVGIQPTFVFKNIRRKLERNWRRAILRADRERYVFQHSVANDMIAGQLLNEFQLVNWEVVSGFVNHLCSKSCTHDPIPSSMFKRCRHYLLPVITRIVNLSLTSRQVPDRFKVAMLQPLLKKNGADHELFSNFHPVSNLYFLSKVSEKAVAAQLMDHLNDNESLLEEFQ